MTPPPHRSIARRLAPALLLAASAYGLFWGRRLFIRSWFEQGAPRPPAAAAATTGPGGAPRQVRVLLIDGLSASVARGLPALSRLCRLGVELDLEVGFPSVSLPVQHALWTGVWQDRSGVMFLVKRMKAPVFESLPEIVTRRGGNAVAITEGEPFIVTSFPFSRVVAPEEGQTGGEQRARAWLTPLDLQQESLAAMQSSAALVLVHFLGVDRAGHEVGSAGATYLAEARRADSLLDGLLEVRRPDQTLLVLSDHGHLSAPPGGHGGTEPAIATTRACLVGPGVPAGRRARALLPDLNRIIAERLAVPPPRRSQGRTLAGVLRGDPTQRQEIPWRWRALAAGLSALALWLALLVWSRRPVLLPWGLLLSLAALVVVVGAPSLSRYYVYRSLPWRLLPVLAPAVLAPAVQLWWLRRRGKVRTPRLAVAVLCGGGLCVAVLAVGFTGWPVFRPPLWPHLTAWASTLVLLVEAWLVGLALAAALDAWRGRGHEL